MLHVKLKMKQLPSCSLVLVDVSCDLVSSCSLVLVDVSCELVLISGFQACGLAKAEQISGKTQMMLWKGGKGLVVCC